MQESNKNELIRGCFERMGRGEKLSQEELLQLLDALLKNKADVTEEKSRTAD